jgi:hypothetical protein
MLANLYKTRRGRQGGVLGTNWLIQAPARDVYARSESGEDTWRSGSFNPSITRSNWAKSRDCGPSDRARSGQGCTSMMRASAPTAIAARETGPMRLCLPVPCDGSATTGRCDSSLASATAARSNVLRMPVSKVFMPRSQRATWSFPPESKYSAANSHSFTEAEGPRLRRMGFLAVASLRRSAKFCILRAPTYSMSAYSQIKSTSSVLITSVTTGIPVISRASPRILSASIPKPWNS